MTQYSCNKAELDGWFPGFDLNLDCLKALKKLRLLDIPGLEIDDSAEAIKEELGLPECEIWI